MAERDIADAVLRKVLVERLEELAVRTGDATLRHAAHIVAARRSPGRPAENDAAALAEIDRRIAAGTPKHRAVAIVARAVATRTGKSPYAVAQRLRSKRRKMHEMDFMHVDIADDPSNTKETTTP